MLNKLLNNLLIFAIAELFEVLWPFVFFILFLHYSKNFDKELEGKKQIIKDMPDRREAKREIRKIQRKRHKMVAKSLIVSAGVTVLLIVLYGIGSVFLDLLW